jgi:hypothetical protein
MSLALASGSGGVRRLEVSARSAGHLFFGDDPDCMDDAGDVPEQREQNVQPEMTAESDFQEYAKRRQQNSSDKS